MDSRTDIIRTRASEIAKNLQGIAAILDGDGDPTARWALQVLKQGVKLLGEYVESVEPMVSVGPVSASVKVEMREPPTAAAVMSVGTARVGLREPPTVVNITYEPGAIVDPKS